MEIEKIIEKIVQKRTKKGYTFENMAYELDITPAAYRKIETGETKLSVERLIKISEILGVNLSDFLDLKNKNIIHELANKNDNNFYAEIMNKDYKDIINDLKEAYDKIIKSKEQILLLKEQIALLKEKK